jgi:hypothetical protein
MLYIWAKPILYEVRYKFSFEDDFLPDDYLIYDQSQELFSNDSVFIEVKEVPLIFETELIFLSLEDLDGVDDYSDYYSSSLQDLDLESDKGIFSLKIKNQDKDLADEIARTLIESLSTQVMNNDLEIFNNTLFMLSDDIKELQEEITLYEDEIAVLEDEIEAIMETDGGEVSSSRGYYDIIEKKDEIVIFREKIIDNTQEIRELDNMYQLFNEEKENLHSRVEIISADPDYDIENDRMMNSIIVILLSLLTAIIAVLAVNYIYKLKDKKN